MNKNNKEEVKVGRPKKSKAGRPKVERIWLLDGTLVGKSYLDKAIRGNGLEAGTVVKEFVVKNHYVVKAKVRTNLIKA